jgi:CHAT domain-containing protein
LIQHLLAYLSAGHTPDISLLDESISLTSAVQLSGFPSVIGSLWEVVDNHSANVTRGVYQWILEGEGRFDARRSAKELHKAVCDLSDKTSMMSRYGSDPLVWAPFFQSRLLSYTAIQL